MTTNADFTLEDWGPDGYSLTIEYDEGPEGPWHHRTVTVPCDPQSLHDALKPWRDWQAEGERLAREAGPQMTEEDLEGYALDDPKRISLQRELDRRAH